jgi:hypothetical protein
MHAQAYQTQCSSRDILHNLSFPTDLPAHGIHSQATNDVLNTIESSNSVDSKYLRLKYGVRNNTVSDDSKMLYFTVPTKREHDAAFTEIL